MAHPGVDSGNIVFFQVYVGPVVWLYLLVVTKPSQSPIYVLVAGF